MNPNDVNDYKLAKAQVDLFPIVTDLAEAQSDRRLIVATSHVAKVGDLIVFMDGGNCGKQIPVTKVDTNTIYLQAHATVVPAVNAQFMIMRPALIKRATPANVAASQTDSSLVAAVASRFIRVVRVIALTGAVATDLTFNSKGAGAGTAISPLFSNDAHSGLGLDKNLDGWFDTNSGEALTCTTGAGSTTGIYIQYAEL